MKLLLALLLTIPLAAQRPVDPGKPPVVTGPTKPTGKKPATPPGRIISALKRPPQAAARKTMRDERIGKHFGALDEKGARGVKGGGRLVSAPVAYLSQPGNPMLANAQSERVILWFRTAELANTWTHELAVTSSGVILWCYIDGDAFVFDAHFPEYPAPIIPTASIPARGADGSVVYSHGFTAGDEDNPGDLDLLLSYLDAPIKAGDAAVYQSITCEGEGEARVCQDWRELLGWEAEKENL